MSIHCYTPTTVSNHKKTNDAWISIHGNVYDVTNFITVVSTEYHINHKFINTPYPFDTCYIAEGVPGFFM